MKTKSVKLPAEYKGIPVRELKTSPLHHFLKKPCGEYRDGVIYLNPRCDWKKTLEHEYQHALIDKRYHTQKIKHFLPIFGVVFPFLSPISYRFLKVTEILPHKIILSVGVMSFISIFLLHTVEEIVVHRRCSESLKPFFKSRWFTLPFLLVIPFVALLFCLWLI